MGYNQKQSPLFDRLNNKILNYEQEIKASNPNIKDTVFNGNLVFVNEIYNYNFIPANTIGNSAIEKKDRNCKYTSRTLIKEVNNKLISDKVNNPYSKDDYRYELFNEPTREQKEWFLDIVSGNHKFDCNIYASAYPAGHEKWEDKENKACDIIVKRKKIPVTAVALNSPFIRINSKNIFNNFIVDIDFPELKGNNEALKAKQKEVITLFDNIGKVLPEFVPNFIVNTSKGFQLGYVFQDNIYSKRKKDILAFTANRKNGFKGSTPILRESYRELEKFYNDTVGKLTLTLSELFNGDKFAIQTYTQGRVVRNPIVNSSVFLTLEKKDLSTCIEKLEAFTVFYKAIVKKDVNPFEYDENAVVEEEKDSKKEKVYNAITALSKDDLRKLEFTVTDNKEEFITKNYIFRDTDEEALVRDLFITYNLPAVDFSKTLGEGYRNTTLFTYGRLFAYELKKLDNKIGDGELYNKMATVISFINRGFEYSLSDTEIDTMLMGIVKFVQTRYNPNINVKENRKLAQWKSLTTKYRFVNEVLANPLLTIKQLKSMAIKQIAEHTSVSYKTLLRWERDIKGMLIKLIKEAQLSLLNKSNNIKVFFSEVKLRLITNVKSRIKQFYKDLKSMNNQIFKYRDTWDTIIGNVVCAKVLSL